ncbi:similar to Saccharomyces cerevisiae YGL060W YBP2 Central kinetochore associated protein that mediates mitotic progression [Maudiozyma saulgeensis]|uniref:Similar to Saccharomyces cerevisiae YGL060W YBP2 Central kinetochore associated protein that mediates mitotic progression n=1 Tax=Maudiozyma saulgeensis TaxID=1789683 RepID=A0A1X7R6L2_9SACH|nr:similar to Saccharomyces cerevisiae YGL060W YBP2 Central kinetochore associated protein that mediates mitotic progression [Kazachstania saulgeensis]
MDLPIEEVCQKLKLAFEEQQDDPVSLVTVIDLFATQIDSNGTLIDKETFLNTIHDSLTDSILQEIGWDLPKTLINFISIKNIETDDTLSKNIILNTVAKCFNKIALKGNPKECLLAACELLSDLKLDSSSEDSNDAIDINESIYHHDNSNSLINENEAIPDIKIHFLFELIITCNNRIDTLYPSKFLAEIVMAFNTFMRNNSESMNEPFFFLKRIYQYIINYNKLQHDRSTKVNDQDQIFKDEFYLENKLIYHLITHSLGQCLKNQRFPFDHYYTGEMEKKSHLKDNKNIIDIFSKFHLLILLYDINLKQDFQNYITESKLIYDRTFEKFNESKNNQADSKLMDFLWGVSYHYTIEKSLKEKTVVADPLGILVLVGAHYMEENTCIIPNLTVTDVIYCYIRYVTTSLRSRLYFNSIAESSLRYCLWITITQNSTNSIKDELNRLPNAISTFFLQVLLLRTCSLHEEEIPEISYTLLSRLLCLFSEKISFDYIINVLTECPHIIARINILSILKVMMTKPIQNIEKQQSTTNSPPQLPPRPYIQANNDTIHKMVDVFVLTINEMTQDMDDENYLNLILDYMNFFVSLRDKCNNDTLSVVYTTVSKFATDNTNETKLPQLEFIKQANDTLKNYLHPKET